MKKRILLSVAVLLMVASIIGCTQSGSGSAAENLDSGSDGAVVDQQTSEAGGEADLGQEEPEEPQTSQIISSGTDVINVIMNGYSARGFTDEVVSDDDLQMILESSAKAPSARNTQPWHFTVVRNKELASQIVSASTEGTVVIVVSGVEEEQEGVNVDFDCALATENMYVAAQSLGLGAHIYTGPISVVNNSMLESLGIPDGYRAVTAICIGYIENPQDAVSSATTRNPLSEMVNYVD